MNNRRNFLKTAALSAIGVAAAPAYSAAVRDGVPTLHNAAVRDGVPASGFAFAGMTKDGAEQIQADLLKNLPTTDG